jgi:hypothetical protein
VDPTKDARAEIEQIEAGLKSRSQALAEKEREKVLGLSFGSAAGSAIVAETNAGN